MTLPKQTKCEVSNCKEKACAWINQQFVCRFHYFKLKKRNPTHVSSWWDDYLKGVKTNEPGGIKE